MSTPLDETLTDIITTIRDNHPRLPNDAPTDEIVQAIIGPICEAMTLAAAE